MRYAKLVDGVVDVVALVEPKPMDGWVMVDDNVFAGFIEDGGEFVPPPPPPIDLDAVKTNAKARIITYADSVTASVLAKYPEAEQRLWPDFEREATEIETLNSADIVLALYPALNGMLDTKYGPPADETEARSRLAAAAPAILTNAADWRAIATYVAGLRARVEDQIDAAADEAAIQSVLDAALAEAETVRAQFGI